MSNSGARRPLNVFYLYARGDEQLCRKLRAHVTPLEQQGLMDSYDAHRVGFGTEKQKEIDSYLDTADIILLLISAHFFASEYCNSKMQRALKRNDVRVIPILLRPVGDTGPVSSLQVLPTNGVPVTRWHNREEAFADIVRSLRGVIEGLPSKSPQSSPGVRNIPYRRNPFFTAREEILQQIHEGFLTDTPGALPQALCGLGGIGKTQIAIEYAYRHRDYYHSILWARANTRDRLILDYMALAESLGIGNKRDESQEHIIAAVKQRLAKERNWLLLFDDVGEISSIDDFVPIEHDGHILLTTRSQAVGTSARKIEVEEMNIEEGVQFLLRRAGVRESEGGTNTVLESERRNASDLVSLLGGLPLALDQAGAYIEETACGIAPYVSRYRNYQTSLLHLRGDFGEDHPEPVATTWSLSFDHVAQINAKAAHLLAFCAFLSPDAIPEELLSISEPERNMHPIIHNSLALDEAIRVLLRFSFVKRNISNNVISIHPLIQTVLKASMGDSDKRKWAEYAIIAVSREFPEFSYEQRNLCQRYVPHALMCLQHITEYTVVQSEAVRVLTCVGLYLHSHAQYDQAKGQFLKALAISEKVFGSEHLETAHCLNKLAELYHMQFELKEAKRYWERALMICESTVGTEHPDTAEILDNLGALHCVQANYTQAEDLYMRALDIREKQLGPDHKDTGQTLGNLGVLYHTQGKLEEAEILYSRAYVIAEQTYGSEHPVTADRLACLATLDHSRGKFQQAELLLKRALAIREKELGFKHPRMAGNLVYLGEVSYDQGDYDQAVVYGQQALAIMETTLGPEHPNTAICSNLLAKIYTAQGIYEKAAFLYQKTLSMMEKQLDVSHPITIKSLHAFALLCQKQRKYEQAEALYRKALSGSDSSANRSALINLLTDYVLFLRNGEEREKIEEVENQINSLQNSSS